MRRIAHPQGEALHGTDATRIIEQAATAALPPHSLMALAGLSVAQLARALAPHARRIWVACGPGNNGGDGLVAATHLLRWAQATGHSPDVVVTLCAHPDNLPADAAHALRQALAAGVTLAETPPEQFDLAIDALLGIGQMRPPTGDLANHLQRLQNSTAPVLCVDVPSGLNADTGAHLLGARQQALPGGRHTLSLLTLKPGLFTADGRDHAGTVWWDDLGVVAPPSTPVSARLLAPSARVVHAHAAHKGLHGEVAVIGGQDIAVNGAGMTGAAVLAARAALRAGAGRVYISLLGLAPPGTHSGWDPVAPELMFRQWHALRESTLLDNASVVCGCGGGSAVADVLPETLERAQSLVLDADGLNAVASSSGLQASLRQRAHRQQTTVLTPHPLEAARMLGSSTAAVMADRLAAARALSERFDCVSVLKGSGTVICAPGHPAHINTSGNAALATAGTGDVLAGCIGAALTSARPDTSTLQRVADAVYHHGWLADHWAAQAHSHGACATLTAGALARMTSAF